MTPKSEKDEHRNPESLDPSPQPDPDPPNDPVEPEKEKKDPSPENCECCRLLREHAIPAIGIANLTKSDFVYDRTISIYKLEPLPTSSTPSSSSSPSNSKVGGASNRSSQDSQPSSSSSSNSATGSLPTTVIPKPKRLLDRFEESRLWDLIGLTPKMYNVLQTELKRITPHKLVVKKCIYRLHNTRHFQVPLNKKTLLSKEEQLKQNYEDDKELLKKKQAFHCHWDECPLSFLDPQDMRIHYMFDHEAVKLFCCGEKYENYAMFLEHYLKDNDELKKYHPTWMVRECWACQDRYVDVDEFYLHCHGCEKQRLPAACPDALCEARFETLTDAVDHFFNWHDKSGQIIVNDVAYPNREAIEPDLHILDEGQMAIAYPFRAIYICRLCNVQFAAEKFFKEHVDIHIGNNQFWLCPTMIQCRYCKIPNCRIYREAVLKFLPNLIETVRNLPTFRCEKHPCLLIWRMFMAEDFIKVMERVLLKLLDEHCRLEVQQEFLDLSKHPKIDPDLPNILEGLHFMISMHYDCKLNELNAFHKLPESMFKQKLELAHGDVQLRMSWA